MDHCFEIRENDAKSASSKELVRAPCSTEVGYGETTYTARTRTKYEKRAKARRRLKVRATELKFTEKQMVSSLSLMAVSLQ